MFFGFSFAAYHQVAYVFFKHPSTVPIPIGGKAVH